MKLGLDELLIVNPGPVAPAESWFLGADGGIYRLSRPADAAQGDRLPNQTALGEDEPVPRFFLGDDGTVYETR